MTEIESSTRWTMHGERVIDESRRLRLSIAEVELPDGRPTIAQVRRLLADASQHLGLERRVLSLACELARLIEVPACKAVVTDVMCDPAGELRQLSHHLKQPQGMRSSPR